VVGVSVSPTRAVTDPLEVKSPLGASRKWRRWPRGQREPSCSCCLVAVCDGGATKEQQPLRKRFSSRSPLDGRAPISPGRPHRQEPQLPGARRKWKERRRPSPQGPPRSFLLWLPFGRPRFRDAEGAISGTLTSSLLPSGTLSPLAAEPLRDDMTGLGSERRGSRQGEKWGECPRQQARSAFKEER
jgi:hypothetical protein